MNDKKALEKIKTQVTLDMAFCYDMAKEVIGREAKKRYRAEARRLSNALCVIEEYERTYDKAQAAKKRK